LSNLSVGTTCSADAGTPFAMLSRMLTNGFSSQYLIKLRQFECSVSDAGRVAESLLCDRFSLPSAGFVDPFTPVSPCPQFSTTSAVAAPILPVRYPRGQEALGPPGVDAGVPPARRRTQPESLLRIQLLVPRLSGPPEMMTSQGHLLLALRAAFLERDSSSGAELAWRSLLPAQAAIPSRRLVLYPPGHTASEGEGDPSPDSDGEPIC